LEGDELSIGEELIRRDNGSCFMEVELEIGRRFMRCRWIRLKKHVGVGLVGEITAERKARAWPEKRVRRARGDVNGAR
jgi:hypothetical protein